MRIAALLTQFLYQHKQLDVPGIGRFMVPESVPIPENGDKGVEEFLKTIEFIHKPDIRNNEDLIDYIRSKTGKIKPLAESDLDSFLNDCKSILNIGKPLYLEGIGTLQKNKDGRIDFMHGQAASERLEVSHSSEKTTDRQKENKPLYNTEYTSQNNQANNLRKMLILGGIIIGIAVVLWGGYLLYMKTTESTDPIRPADNNNTVPTVDTSRSKIDSSLSIPPDSLVQSTVGEIPTANPIGGTYKFICEITQTKARALRRFQMLQQLNKNFKMETRDSVRFSIYVVLPITDTTKQKDSLKLWYWGAGGRDIIIEK